MIIEPDNFQTRDPPLYLSSGILGPENTSISVEMYLQMLGPEAITLPRDYRGRLINKYGLVINFFLDHRKLLGSTQ